MLQYSMNQVENGTSDFSEPDIYFNNQRFYDYMHLMPAMLDLYFYENRELGWFIE